MCMCVYIYICIYARIECMHLIEYYKTTSMNICMVLELEIQLIACGQQRPR